MTLFDGFQTKVRYSAILQKYKGSTIGNSISSVKSKKKSPYIDYSSNLVKELALLGEGGGTTLPCQISNPLTMPVWQA